MRASISSSLAPHTDFALRSYRDGDEHYDGQIGSEPTPADFLRALWAVMDECWRVLKPTGVACLNLGDKYAGSGGHNNSAISSKTTLTGGKRKLQDDEARRQPATRRNAPDRYNQATDVRAKSVMGLPWRFALGLSIPDPYRTCYDPGDHPQWINRRPLIWDKPNGLPESVTDRPRASSEDWFILTKQGRYFSAIDEIRESHLQQHSFGRDRQALRREGKDGSALPVNDDRANMWFGQNPLGKLPGSVWSIPSEPLIVPEWAKERYNLPDHFAAFPQEWPRRLILAFSPNGICMACNEGRRPVVDKTPMVVRPSERRLKAQAEGNASRTATGGTMTQAPATKPGVVLDPFGGTGTTAMVARALGRIGISVDLSLDYSRLARWRIHESGHGKKAIQRTAKERQGSML